MLAFEVVNFFGPYHVILGQPCYHMFMAIPSYAYFKLKITGPTGVVTVEAKTQQDSIELGTTVVPAVELRELNPRVTLASLSLATPPMFGTFKAAEDAKALQIDAGDPAKTV
jgi:hypothetical protein